MTELRSEYRLGGDTVEWRVIADSPTELPKVIGYGRTRSIEAARDVAAAVTKVAASRHTSWLPTGTLSAEVDELRRLDVRRQEEIITLIRQLQAERALSDCLARALKDRSLAADALAAHRQARHG